jgi:uncharacterized phage infection (PIP) family protein YhgE
MSEVLAMAPALRAPRAAAPPRARRPGSESAVAQWKRQLTWFAASVTLLVVFVAAGSAAAMWQVVSQIARAERGDEARSGAAIAARLAVLEVDRLLLETVTESDPARIRSVAVASIAAASRLEDAVTQLHQALPGNQDVTEMGRLLDGVKAQRVQVIVLARRGDRAEASAARQAIAAQLQRIDTVSAAILDAQAENRRQASAERNALFEGLLYLLLVASCVFACAGLLFYRRLMQRFSPVEQLLDEVAHSARELDEGGQRLDDVNHAVQECNQHLQAVLERFQGSREVMAEEARACLRDVDQLGETCQTSAGMSRQHADEAAQVAEQIHAMAQRLHQLLETTKALHRSRSDIARFADQIEGISATTRLLSLNAAVEAARAGAAGRGFSVIANSVRKLSEDTQQAALQIRRASEDITRQLASTTAAVQDTSALMDEGAGRIQALDSSARSNQALVDGMRQEVQGFRGSFQRQMDRMQALEQDTRALAEALQDGEHQARQLDETSAGLAQTSQALLQRLSNLQA